MPSQTSFTYSLTDSQQKSLDLALKSGNYIPVSVEHAKFAARNDSCSITLYKSGKCVIQGKGAEDFVAFVLEPLVLRSVSLGYEDILNPEAVEPHIGIDESGKGDFFGPLVVASAYVDKPLAEKMRAMNVRDSKSITSDSKAVEMGRALREMLGKRHAIVKIGPAAYNRLYAKMRNVNTMLGWAHARAIENMLEVLPDCPRAISDQFGSKSQVERALMKKGSRIELIQRHKAESDLAVAAASIIAREGFLRSLYDMREKYKIAFPKGASEAVKDAAVELARKHGPNILVETAKCHFRTTDQALERLSMDRKSLGPEGQAVSKTLDRNRFFKKKSAPTEDSAEGDAPDITE